MDAILKQPVVMRYTGQVVWNDPVIITPNIPDGIFDCE
jgi:hypothetical protein